MKMEVHGIGKAEKTWVKMVTDVGGQGWVVNHAMVPRNGKKRYKLILSYDDISCMRVLYWSEAKEAILCEVICVIDTLIHLYNYFQMYIY